MATDLGLFLYRDYNNSYLSGEGNDQLVYPTRYATPVGLTSEVSGDLLEKSSFSLSVRNYAETTLGNYIPIWSCLCLDPDDDYFDNFPIATSWEISHIKTTSIADTGRRTDKVDEVKYENGDCSGMCEIYYSSIGNIISGRLRKYYNDGYKFFRNGDYVSNFAFNVYNSPTYIYQPYWGKLADSALSIDVCPRTTGLSGNPMDYDWIDGTGIVSECPIWPKVTWNDVRPKEGYWYVLAVVDLMKSLESRGKTPFGMRTTYNGNEYRSMPYPSLPILDNRALCVFKSTVQQHRIGDGITFEYDSIPHLSHLYKSDLSHDVMQTVDYDGAYLEAMEKFCKTISIEMYAC